MPAPDGDLPSLEPTQAYRDMIQKIYGREEARRENVERQAMTLLGVTGLVSSLWSGLGGVLLQFAQKSEFTFTPTSFRRRYKRYFVDWYRYCMLERLASLVPGDWRFRLP